MKELLDVSEIQVIKPGPGTLVTVSVSTAGASAGAVYDCAKTGDIAAGNQIGVVPNAIGITEFVWPCAVGIVYAPGSGQIADFSFS